MSAHSYIYVTIFYFIKLLIFQIKKNNFLKMMLTYHISHGKNFQVLSLFLGVLGLSKYDH